MLIDEIKELNEALYKACGELKENRGHINKPEHQDSIEEKLFELYELDFKLIRGKFEAEEKLAAELEIQKAVRINETARRKRELTPYKKRRWYAPWSYKTNRTEELLKRESGANAGIFLNAREQAVKQLEKIIEEADKGSEEVLKPLSRKEKRELKRNERRERKEKKKENKKEKGKKAKEKTQAKLKKQTENTQQQGQTGIEEPDTRKDTTKADEPAAADIPLTAEK